MKWLFTLSLMLTVSTLLAQLDVRNSSIVNIKLELEEINLLTLPPVKNEPPPRDVKLMETPVFNMPQTSEPFFCRIEDQISSKTKVQFKFRLGSVQYVDAMEGKAYFEAVGYSRATTLLMSQTGK